MKFEKNIYNKTILIILLTAVVSIPLSAKTPRYPYLNEGTRLNGTVYPGSENKYYKTYILDDPETALGISLKILKADADLDLYLNHNKEIEDYSDVDFVSEKDDWHEEIRIFCPQENWFPEGRYFLDVAYTLDELPRDEYGVIKEQVDFTIEYTVFDAGNYPQKLIPGKKENIELNSGNGFVSCYEVSLPSDWQDFRVNILNTPGDVDLYLSEDRPVPDGRSGYSVIAESYLGRESLIVSRENISFDAEKLYVTIMEATDSGFPVPAEILLTLGEGLPGKDFTETLPELKTTGNINVISRLATVQIVSNAGMGSGCIVGEDGYVITNNHVIRDDNNRIVSNPVIAVLTDPYEEPHELFIADVIRASPENDLALLKITGDRWGNPLPADYKFPSWKTGRSEDLEIGDSLELMGYPMMGSSKSRTHFTLTEGILSGGEKTSRGLILKTDAVISGGSSGGAVCNSDKQLVGFPTFLVYQDSAQLTYFIPVSRIPGEWLKFF